jgi:hypothetical protein
MASPISANDANIIDPILFRFVLFIVVPIYQLRRKIPDVCLNGKPGSPVNLQTSKNLREKMPKCLELSEILRKFAASIRHYVQL